MATDSNAYGSIPGAISNPASSFGELSSVYPNLGGSTGQASADIMKELQGQLSPEALANLQRASAQFGVGSGMPGSGLAINKNLLSNVLTTEDLQHQGIGDYLSTVTGLSKTQLDPSLAAEISARNSNMAAAPDPAAAAAAGQNAFQRGLGLTRGGLGTLPQLGAGQQHANLNEPGPVVLSGGTPDNNQVITPYIPGTTTPAGVGGLPDYSSAPWGGTGSGGGSTYFGPQEANPGSMYDVPDLTNPQTPFDPNADYFGLPGAADATGGGGGDALYDLG